jgi:hypothetical protein
MPKAVRAAIVIIWIRIAFAVCYIIAANVTAIHKVDGGFWGGLQNGIASDSGAPSLAEYTSYHARRISVAAFIVIVFWGASLWAIKARRFWPAFIFSLILILAGLSGRSFPILSIAVLILVCVASRGYWAVSGKDRRPQQAENRPNLAKLIASVACLIAAVAFAWLAVVMTGMGGNRTIPEAQQRDEKKSFDKQLQEIQATTHTLDDTSNIFPSFHLPSLPSEETQNDTSLRSSTTNSAKERLESIYRESGRTQRRLRLHAQAVPGEPQATVTVNPSPSPPP